MMYSIYNNTTGETIMGTNARALFQVARFVARADNWPLPVCVTRDGQPIAAYTADGWKWWD